jgi:hypothetical protein
MVINGQQLKHDIHMATICWGTHLLQTFQQPSRNLRTDTWLLARPFLKEWGSA